MHYTGTIWRPPYEAGSLLLEATIGCTHHRCKFCTLYDDLPVSFRMAPLEHIESDLLEVQTMRHSPRARAARQLTDRPEPAIERVFLTGANPFVLTSERLERIAGMIHDAIPECHSIGCFARITDVAQKTDAELRALRACGYDGLTIGVETGDDQALAFMDKGYTAADIVRQCRRLDAAGIGYHFFYLTGVSGAGRGEVGAIASAQVFNQTHPRIIGASMLTIFPESRLYQEIQRGNWREAGELEKIAELKTLIAHLEIPADFATLGASNAIWICGRLPEDRERMLNALEQSACEMGEAQLREYRESLRHL